MREVKLVGGPLDGGTVNVFHDQQDVAVPLFTDDDKFMHKFACYVEVKDAFVYVETVPHVGFDVKREKK